MQTQCHHANLTIYRQKNKFIFILTLHILWMPPFQPTNLGTSEQCYQKSFGELIKQYMFTTLSLKGRKSKGPFNFDNFLKSCDVNILAQSHVICQKPCESRFLSRLLLVEFLRVFYRINFVLLFITRSVFRCQFQSCL